MSTERVKKLVRLVVLAAAAMVTVHILIDDGRSDWLALTPGTILASAAGHFLKRQLDRRALVAT